MSKGLLRPVFCRNDTMPEEAEIGQRGATNSYFLIDNDIKYRHTIR